MFTVSAGLESSNMHRCLVIDDSRIIRKVARCILEDLNFDTAEAEDTEIALEYCRSGMPELILLDFDLPNGNGVEFVRKVRHEPNGERPVIVFCTTDNDVLQISQALAAGANDYLQKPFDRETLVAKLANAGLIKVPVRAA
jgi:two-component system, chemotaxis family, chemotaxis protein CheY